MNEQSWTNRHIYLAEEAGMGRWIWWDKNKTYAQFHFYWPFKLFSSRAKTMLKRLDKLLPPEGES